MSAKNLKSLDKSALEEPAIDLSALIQADRQAREQRAAVKYQRLVEAIQAEERCTITPIMIIRTGNIEARIEFKALD